MEDEYQIIDNRNTISFKKETFSGYKKNDVFKALFKSIESKKIENSLNWLVECIISGYVTEVWDKLLLYIVNVININNPNIVNILYKKNILFNNICNRYDLNKNKEEILLLRNNSEIRNIFSSLIVILLDSDKNKRYDEYPKLKDEDFCMDSVLKRMNSKFNLLPNNFVHFNEPSELKLILNELYYNIKNTDNNGYENSIYWIIWIIKWEKMNKKNLKNWNIDERNEDVNKKYRSDVIWMIWNIIFLELENKDNLIRKQVKSLYELYISNYSLNKKIKRLPYIYCSILYLTQQIDFSIKILNNLDLYLRIQLNINNLFKNKKIYEKNNIVKIKDNKKNKKENKNQKQIVKEKCLDKLSVFNDIDNI